MRPPPVDLELGLETYVTGSQPVEARLRLLVVEEIPPPGLRIGGRGRYALYLLEKNRLTTAQALSRAARILGVSTRLIGYAGLKDKEAVTRQYISVPAGLASKLVAEVADRGIVLRLIGFSDKPIRRGMLRGNRFEARLSTPSPAELCSAFNELRVIGGIPGYYGYQRFGTRRPNTHRVGMMIHRRLWSEAVREIAGHPYPLESPESREARMLFDEGRYEEAYRKYPRSLLYERMIAGVLAKGRSPLQALKALPGWLLELYLDAYSSYLYNRILSRKLALTGGNPALLIEGEGRPGCLEAGNECEGRLPVPGYGLRMNRLRGEVRSIVSRVLEVEEASPRLFKVDELGIMVKARWRSSFAPFLGEARCMAGGGRARMFFSLPKGMYASIVLREVTKLEPHRLGL